MMAPGDECRAGGPGAPGAASNADDRLVEILLASLTELAAAGRVETACRLAGQACAALRRRDRKAEHRFNALLHRLSRQLTW
jgi:hypothetical protein